MAAVSEGFPTPPPLPPDAAVGVICVCGSAWFRASVAIRDDWGVNFIAAPTCAECGSPAPAPRMSSPHAPRID